MTTLGWTCHTRAAPSCDMFVWHVQPRVVIFPCRTHYRPSSVKCKQNNVQNITFDLVIGRESNSWLHFRKIFTTCHPRRCDMVEHVTLELRPRVTFNIWRTVVSATWKYDDPRLNMSHEGAAGDRAGIELVTKQLVEYLQHVRTTSWQSIMLKVTWRRFDQSAKQLLVGQTISSTSGRHIFMSHLLLSVIC